MVSAYDILNAAIEQYAPSHVFAMFSGGYDSLVTAHITAQHPRFSGCVHINTGTGIPETREYVYETCRAQGWPLKEYHGNVDEYRAWVLAHGFPGPSMHNRMYNRLKDRGIAALVREHKQRRHDKIMLVSGVRAQESSRRMGYARTVNIDPSSSSRVWVNPIYYWSKDDVLDYRDDHSLPHNPVVDLLHRSGECNCGAFAQAGELADMTLWYPEVAAWIRDLESQVRAAGFPWGWEGGPPSWYQAEQAGQERLFDFMPLCSSCEAQRQNSAPDTAPSLCVAYSASSVDASDNA